MRRGTVLKVDVQLNLYLYLLNPITKCHFGVQSTILYYKEVLQESNGKNRLVFKKNDEHFRPITFFWVLYILHTIMTLKSILKFKPETFCTRYKNCSFCKIKNKTFFSLILMLEVSSNKYYPPRLQVFKSRPLVEIENH